MKNKLLPDRGSKIWFALILGFMLLGIGFIAFSDDKGTGVGALITGGIAMVVLLIKNATARPGQ